MGENMVLMILPCLVLFPTLEAGVLKITNFWCRQGFLVFLIIGTDSLVQLFFTAMLVDFLRAIV